MADFNIKKEKFHIMESEAGVITNADPSEMHTVGSLIEANNGRY